MSFWRHKNDLKEEIERLNSEIDELTKENKVLKEEKAEEIYRLDLEKDRLMWENISLKEENRQMLEKYVNNNKECDFCYTTLQKEFVYCPKCGKKLVDDSIDTVSSDVRKNIFKVENDLDGVLITQYTGFDDKIIVIPSKINRKKVIGIWNETFKNCNNIEEVIFEEGC